MNFRTIRRLMYLKRARHRHGHGIHSPFLFRLITCVVEDKRKQPEYELAKKLRKSALKILYKNSDPSFTSLYHQFKLSPSKTKKLFKKVELPLKYGKVIFRLIREFKPSCIVNYGPAFGVNLALMALAKNDSFVYQVINNVSYRQVCAELIKKANIPNIYYYNEYQITKVVPEFIIVNYPDNPARSWSIVKKLVESNGEDDVLIIRGIHESCEMETLWNKAVEYDRVRVSLDLFEIGILLFRKGLQKENFIHRF